MTTFRRGIFPIALGLGLASAAPLTAQQGELMPQVVQDQIREMSARCGTPEEMLSKPGFYQLADLNSDFRLEVLLDGASLGCRYYCGARNCSVWLFASDAAGGYRMNEFLSPGAHPTMFACAVDGTCRFVQP